MRFKVALLLLCLLATPALAQQGTTSGPVVPTGRFFSSAGWSPTGNSSGTLLQQGLGSTWVYPGSNTGHIHIVVTGSALCSAVTSTAPYNIRINASYGTGTAPANGAAVAGTTVLATDLLGGTAAVNGSPFFSLEGDVPSTAANTQYWFDLQMRPTGNCTTATLSVNSVTISAY